MYYSFRWITSNSRREDWMGSTYQDRRVSENEHDTIRYIRIGDADVITYLTYDCLLIYRWVSIRNEYHTQWNWWNLYYSFLSYQYDSQREASTGLIYHFDEWWLQIIRNDIVLGIDASVWETIVRTNERRSSWKMLTTWQHKIHKMRWCGRIGDAERQT